MNSTKTVLQSEMEKKQNLKNAIILGSGRCGTSMVTGLLSRQPYYMGNNLYAGTHSNPKGFFESWEINSINEDLLMKVLPKKPRFIGKWFFKERLAYEQGWLGRIPAGTVITSSPSINERIARQTGKQPFCYKDTRFPYTLPAWRPFLKNTVFICVFRDPGATAKSVVKACRTEKYLKGVYINHQIAMEMWALKYRHILETHRHSGDWLFFHYNQGFTEKGLDRLSQFLNVEVDRTFPDKGLDRSRSADDIPKDVRQIYQDLCDLAGYSGEMS